MRNVIIFVVLIAFAITAGCINGPPYIVMNDLNNDGIQDMVITVYATESSEDKIFIFMGGANDSFAKREATVDSIEKQSTIVMDINKDGFSDIIYKNTGSTWKVLYGKGDGFFEKRKDIETRDMKYIKDYRPK